MLEEDNVLQSGPCQLENDDCQNGMVSWNSYHETYCGKKTIGTSNASLIPPRRLGLLGHVTSAEAAEQFTYFVLWPTAI
jgi:hypothetical protein